MCQVMSSGSATTIATTATVAMAGTASKEVHTTGPIADTNALATLLDTITSTVREELRRQLLPVTALVSVTGPSMVGPSQSHPPLTSAKPATKEGTTGE